MKVYLDTNIWYYLGADKILRDLLRDLPLQVTLVNLTEIGTTKNLIGANPDVIRNCIHEMLELKKEFDLTSPFHQLALSKLDIGPIQTDPHEPLLGFIRKIDNGLRFEGETKKRFYNLQQMARSPFEKIAAAITNYTMKVYKDKKIRTELENNSSKQSTWNLACWFVKEAHNIDMTGATSENVNFFLFTFDAFLRHLCFNGRKMRGNDFSDLMNMAYVNPGDKYLTADNFMLKKIKEADVDDFLINDPKILHRIQWIQRKI